MTDNCSLSGPARSHKSGMVYCDDFGDDVHVIACDVCKKHKEARS